MAGYLSTGFLFFFFLNIAGQNDAWFDLIPLS